MSSILAYNDVHSETLWWMITFLFGGGRQCRRKTGVAHELTTEGDIVAPKATSQYLTYQRKLSSFTIDIHPCAAKGSLSTNHMSVTWLRLASEQSQSAKLRKLS